MTLGKLLLTALGLSMDAFAIAVCKGLSVEKVRKKHLVITGLWFGGAQAIMPLLGYLLGTGFQSFIESIDHWIAFALLAIVQLFKRNVKRDGNLKVPVAFVPYISTAFHAYPLFFFLHYFSLPVQVETIFYLRFPIL